MNNKVEGGWGGTGQGDINTAEVEREEGRTSSRLQEGPGRPVARSEKDVLAADKPAIAAPGRLQLQRARALRVLRGSNARVPPAQDRGPAGKDLDGPGHRGAGLQMRGPGGGESRRPPEGLPVHRGARHRARAVRREATPVGREQQMVPLQKMTRSRILWA